MATPKHILRIHDTEANLFANLKDTQIAFATDTNRIIWREGSSFWTFDAGLNGMAQTSKATKSQQVLLRFINSTERKLYKLVMAVAILTYLLQAF